MSYSSKWSTTRSQSAPLPTHHSSRPRSNNHIATPYLVPRIEVIDDRTQGRLLVRLEIPDVNPSDVHIKLRGDMLYISGERLPDTSSVAQEYLENLKRHSQSVPGSRHLPRVILLGGGNVESFSVPPEYLPSLAKRSPHRTTPSPSGRIVAQRAHYNELRFGKFCRRLRLPPGTKASDIEGSFVNGMLLLSWPRASAPEAFDQKESTDVNIPIYANVCAPVVVKIESVEPMSIDSPQ